MSERKRIIHIHKNEIDNVRKLCLLLFFIMALVRVNGQTVCDDTVSSPYCFGFEITSPNPPCTWHIPYSTYAVYPEVSSVHVFSGEKSLRMAYNCYAVMPPIQRGSQNSLFLQWMMHGASINVGILTDPNDTSTFTPLTYTTTSVGNWQECCADLSAVTAETFYFCFHSSSTSSTCIDNISLQNSHISDIYPVEVNDSSALVHYLSSSPNDSVSVEWGASGFAQGTGTVSDFGGDTLFLLSSLLPGSDYDYFVYPLSNGIANPCISIRRQFSTAFITRFDTTLCQNKLPIVWRDSIFNAAGAKETHYLSINGIDSIVVFSLTVNDTSASDSVAVVCDSIVWNGLTYSTSGNYQSQLPLLNSVGCDSVATLHLTVSYSSTGDTTAVSCDEMTWKEDTYTTSGDYNSPFTVPNQAGCDSTTILHLTINYSNSGDTVAVVCDSLVWEGLTYSTSGNYQSQLQLINSSGCDSAATLLLTVNQSYDTVEHIASCDYLTWIDGFTYTSSIYGPQMTLSSISGCDSTVTLDFHLYPSAQTFIYDSFCAGETYHFAGDDLIAGGSYYITLKTVDMCDSIVTLILTRLPQPTIHIDDNVDCETLTHTLVATADVDYLHWSMEEGAWNSNWGPEYSSTLIARLNKETTLNLLADYYDTVTCPASTQITIYPIVQPLAQFTVSPERLNYQQTSLTATDHSTGATGLRWWIDDNDMGGNSTIEYSPDMSNDSVTITLIANSLYCVDSTTKVIYIFRQSLFAPNAFTPDENQNNRFVIKSDGIIDFNLSIFNRRGQMVFHTTDPQQGWDGTYKGKRCPQGAYIWILKYTNSEEPKIQEFAKGSVLLLR